MVLSMFDQMLFSLACGHTVVLGRLDKTETWKCETCGMVTDLRFEPIATGSPASATPPATSTSGSAQAARPSRAPD